ncbi:uncharacterized protein LOC144173654 [Haemaphysalis longicornis]
MAIIVSVTMKGRIYKPKTPDPAVSSIGNYGLYSECEQGNYVQEIGPLSICDNATYTSNLAINNTYQAVVAFSKVAGYTLVFDNSITLLKKVCGAKKKFDQCRHRAHHIRRRPRQRHHQMSTQPGQGQW